MGFRGRIHAIVAGRVAAGMPAPELERRLIELGFVEGADVEVLHEGLFGRIPSPCASRIRRSGSAAARRWPSSSRRILT